MKQFFVALVIGSALYGQGEQSRHPQPGTQPQPQPSDLMKESLKAQDVTITIHISGELATAIEKRRRDDFAPVTQSDGSTLLAAKHASLSAQIMADMQSYFNQLMQRYPSESVRAAQLKAAMAMQEAQDAAAKAATPVIK